LTYEKGILPQCVKNAAPATSGRRKKLELALNRDKKFAEIKEIKQRITALKDSLLTINKSLQSFYR